MKVKVMLASLLFFVLAVTAVHAESPNYDIAKVEVNDLDADSLMLDVERGEDLEIEVYVKGNESIANGFIDDVRIEAEIIGYEFGPISDTTPLFDVEQGITYKKVLRLRMPDDIDSSEHYTLRIRVSDKIDEEERIIALNIDEQRHSLNIFDIILTPQMVQAGKPVFGLVRLENLGAKEENDIQVIMSIPQLGVSVAGFVPELVTQQQEEKEEFFEQQSSDQIEFILRIPEDAPTGEYTVVARVVYNRGHSELSETRTISVQALPQVTQVETIVNPEATSKTAAANGEVAYRIMVANLGSEKGVYSIQLDGTQWADARVEPGFLTVLPDSTGEFTIFVKPLQGADARTYTFNARVLIGNEVVSDVILQTKVEPAVEAKESAATFKTVLAAIFVILVIILIVLGIIIAVRRSGEEEETPSTPEGQTYYYSPRK